LYVAMKSKKVNPMASVMSLPESALSLLHRDLSALEKGILELCDLSV
jgi:hypothetical protein